jgi:flagellar secretion chaperone FliS
MNEIQIESQFKPMNAKQNQLAYQEAAVRNANPIDLVIMLYDILARDLHSAIEAMEAGNIELRSAKLKHGFLALQQLEGSLNMDGGEMATSMSRYYSMLRAQMMKAQIQQDAGVLRELVQLLFSVREAWDELNSRLTASVQAPASQIQTASWKA